MWVLFTIISIILFIITIFIDRHTYYYNRYSSTIDLDKPVKLPLYIWLCIIVSYSIPIVNIIVFCIGAINWIFDWDYNRIGLGKLPKWVKDFFKFLNKPVKF